MASTTVEGVLMELRDCLAQQSAVPTQTDPFTVYWDALRRFFRAQLSKAELEGVIRSTLPADAVVLHNRLLLALHAAAEKIVADNAFTQGYASVALAKPVGKRERKNAAGKTGRGHRSKQAADGIAAAAAAAAAALQEQQEQQEQQQKGAADSSSSSSSVPSGVPSGPLIMPTRGGFAGGAGSGKGARGKKAGSSSSGGSSSSSSGRKGARAGGAGDSRGYPAYRGAERRAWRRLLQRQAGLAAPQYEALRRRMVATARRAGVAEVAPEAAQLVWASAEHRLRRLLASATPTPPPQEAQRGMQQNPFRVFAGPPRPAHDVGPLVRAHTQAFNAHAAQDAAAPLLRRHALTVDVSPRSPLRAGVLGPSCWVFTASRGVPHLSHPTSTTLTQRDLRTLFDLNPAELSSTEAAQVVP